MVLHKLKYTRCKNLSEFIPEAEGSCAGVEGDEGFGAEVGKGLRVGEG